MPSDDDSATGLGLSPGRAELVNGVGDELGQLMASLRSLSHHMAALIDPELQAAGVWVLRWLSHNGPSHAGRIATELLMDKGAVSRQLRALRELGLVRSEPDPLDGRATLVQLTEEGRARLERIREIGRNKFYGRIENWSDKDLRAFSAMLGRFNDPNA
jgi:DNA-binding MarR family transcriptional regulator